VIVISLDTTTRAGSVALVDGDRIVDERAGDGARTHAQRLPAEITALLDAHALAMADVDLYAVASGPGSFTGLRIGIATVQGLAFVHGRRVVGVPALDALAHLASIGLPPGAVVAAWMDAHRHEVFAGVYRVTSAAAFTRARLEQVEPSTAGDPAATLARWRDELGVRPSVAIGDGAVLYAAAIAEAYPDARVLPPPPLAGAIGRLAIDGRADAVTPADLRAVYVRRPDVELEREKNTSSLR
jgi:tRNA threonylcarbamoyladenosine biosynthesis protein TsaB